MSFHVLFLTCWHNVPLKKYIFTRHHVALVSNSKCVTALHLCVEMHEGAIDTSSSSFFNHPMNVYLHKCPVIYYCTGIIGLDNSVEKCTQKAPSFTRMHWSLKCACQPKANMQKITWTCWSEPGKMSVKQKEKTEIEKMQLTGKGQIGAMYQMG